MKDKPDKELEERVIKLIEKIGKQRFSHYGDLLQGQKPVNPKQLLSGEKLRRWDSSSDRFCYEVKKNNYKRKHREEVYIDHVSVQRKALKELLSMKRDEVFPIILNLDLNEIVLNHYKIYAGVEKHKNEIFMTWKIDNKYLLELAAEDHGSRVSTACFYFLWEFNFLREDYVETYKTLLSMANKSKEWYLVKNSLRHMWKIGIPTEELKKQTYNQVYELLISDRDADTKLRCLRVMSHLTPLPKEAVKVIKKIGSFWNFEFKHSRNEERKELWEYARQMIKTKSYNLPAKEKIIYPRQHQI